MSDRIELPHGIALDDPRPIAASAPYTYSMPWPQELAALEPGDGVQAIFREIQGGRHYDAERMWVGVEAVENGWIRGRLDNEPYDMPSIKLHDPVTISLTHVISVTYRDGKAWPDVPKRRWYWERCMVDTCVVDGKSHVDYLYREDGDLAGPDDTYPDSGWRIRGTDDGIAEDQRLGLAPQYIALGKVLNADDRWLHLIDREVGCAFLWDPASDDYLEVE